MAKNRSASKKPKRRSARGTTRRDLRSRFTRRDRDEVLREVETLLDSDGLEEVLGADACAGLDEFFECGRRLPASMNAETVAALEEMIDVAYRWWAAFDLPLTPEGLPLVELELERSDLPPGHRAFIQAAKSARMRLYDVVALAPGRSVTLRDLFSDAAPVKVRAQIASRGLKRGELIATRIVRGPSGRLELDGGLFRYTEEQRPAVLDAVELHLAYFDEFEPDADDDLRWATMPPVLHHLFRDFAMIDAPDPTIDDVMSTHVIFRAGDTRAVSNRLDADDRLVRLDREPTTWAWVDPELGVEIPLGLLDVEAEHTRLTLHTCCLDHADTGRKLVEDLLDGLVEYDHHEISLPRDAFEGDPSLH